MDDNDSTNSASIDGSTATKWHKTSRPRKENRRDAIHDFALRQRAKIARAGYTFPHLHRLGFGRQRIALRRTPETILNATAQDFSWAFLSPFFLRFPVLLL